MTKNRYKKPKIDDKSIMQTLVLLIATGLFMILYVIYLFYIYFIYLR